MSKKDNISSIDLGRLPVGEPIMFRTSSGKIYTLVRTARSTRTPTVVSRVLIASVGKESGASSATAMVNDQVPRFFIVLKSTRETSIGVRM